MILHNADCFSILLTIPDKSVELICTDPPYTISRKSNFNVGGAWNNAADKRFQKTPPKTDFGEWDKRKIDLSTFVNECYRILKPSGTFLCFYDIWKMQELKDVLEQSHFKQLRLCRWDKTNPVPVNSKLNYLSNVTEYFVTAVKGSKPTFHSEYDKGIYVFPICHGNERTSHPTQKPLQLIGELIEKHSNKGDTVLDPFMGSGTTGVACVKTNRNFIGIELDPQYFEIAKERINQGKE